MNVLTAITMLRELLAVVSAISTQAKIVSDMLKKAQDEKRDITDAELAYLKSLDDTAKKALDDAIANGGS